MRKTLLTLLVCIFSVFTAMADLPFRNHRYDALNVLKVKADNIVFVGNSITNMHEWWEAFGNHKVLNRGVSGAVSTEMLANLDNVLSGRPAKIFLMIGTNDLGTTGVDTPDKVAQNVRIAVQRCVTKSPETEVYVQSILPTKDASNRPGKTLANLTATNDKIKAICEEYQTQNVTYVDLWEDLLEVMQNNKHSLDNLHLAASGYAIWCNKIKQLVNGENGTTVYPATGTTNSYGGLNGSFGMRNSYFNCYPVKTGDILLIGDETIHGGEWHELLQSDKVKNRGTGWGAPGSNDLDVIKSSLPNIFHGTQQPAQVYLYAGMGGFNSATYQEIVNTIKSYAPSAKIYLMSLLSASKTYENSQIQSIAAASGANVEYLDLYAQMGSLLDNPKYFNNGYVYGLGYIKMAEIMAPKMGLSAVKPPMTPETSEPTPFVTIEETTLSGQPIKVAADVAQKVFEKNTMTVAIDITPSGLSSQQSNTIIGSVNSGRSKFFAHVLRKGNAMGVQYTLANNTEGWFTQDDGGTMFNNNRQKLVITMNESTKIYGYYRNGHLLRNIDVSTNSAWGFATFGSLNGSTGAELYLGGIPNSSGNLNHTSGTIHSIRFYDKVLTADEISNLNWDNNGGEPIDPDPEPASESIEIFGTSSETSIPYRIPAIAQAKNGTLIAAADYRYSKEDIGVATDGELDIHARISKDNGKTWETKKVIADGNGQGGSGSAAFNHAFGTLASLQTVKAERSHCSAVPVTSVFREVRPTITKVSPTSFPKTTARPGRHREILRNNSIPR